MFSKNNLEIINSIKKNRTKFDVSLTSDNSNKLEKISAIVADNLVAYNWKTYIILGVIGLFGIVGLILLLTLGPSRSLYFEYSNQIIFVFPSSQRETAYTIANQLSQQLNVD